MPHDPRKLLEDMRLASDRVQRFTTGIAWADYENNEMLRSAVERQFEIMGEALSRLLKLDATFASGITEHRRIIGFRNILIHGYDAIDDAVVWDVVTKDLPTFLREVEVLLSGLSSP